ncbi:MAG: hypothetical protein ACRDSL_23685 [Pseudonocardiaceae bacterium]
MTTRRTLVVKGRQDTRVTVVVEVCRNQVWVVSVDSPFSSEAIFEPAQVDSLIDILEKAAAEARRGKANAAP